MIPEQMHRGILDGVRVLRIELGIANDRVAAAAGLHARDLDVLDVIDRDAPCTPGHLSARTGIRPATLTGILTRLERDGWLQRCTAPTDARSRHLWPTARFEELRELYAATDAGVLELLATLPDEAVPVIIDFLQQAATLIRRNTSGTEDRKRPNQQLDTKATS